MADMMKSLEVQMPVQDRPTEKLCCMLPVREACLESGSEYPCLRLTVQRRGEVGLLHVRWPLVASSSGDRAQRRWLPALLPPR